MTIKMVKADKWLPTALTIAAARHANGYLASAIAEAKPLASGKPGEPPAMPQNLVANGNIEQMDGDQPHGWKVSTYAGNAEHGVVPFGRNGGNCLAIGATGSGADTSWQTPLKLEENTDYLLSCWIKTEGIKGATGALLEVHSLNGAQPRSQAVTGTSDWQQVSFKISTGRQRDILLNCLYGGWGRSTGKAWFDDISCVKLGPSGGSEGGGNIAAIARTFGRLATPTQLAALNALVASKPSATSRIVSESLRNPVPPKVDEDLAALAKTHQVQEIKAVEGLKYDVMDFTLKAGQPIALIFQNADQLQHNLVVAKPGAIERCCTAADAMAAQPDAIQKQYIPTLDDILTATKLLNPGEVEVVKFEKLTPGEYPYLCTFPGHCHVMRGTMKVVP